MELFPDTKFLKFEKLNEDFDLLLNELGLQDLELPHRNAGDREDYRKYYDEETIEIVATRHKYEINLGNYKF